MKSDRISLLKNILEQGVGAGLDVRPDVGGVRSGLRCHFSGLTQNQGPIVSIAPAGLVRHRVSVRFGAFAAECIAQMQSADAERTLVARALVKLVSSRHDVVLTPPQGLDVWSITGPDFGIDVTVRDVGEPASEESISKTAKEVMVPLLAAMAELIGYDEIQSSIIYEPEVEGQVTEALIRRRERSRRNRLVCLEVHGRQCKACGFQPERHYQIPENLLEVHHLEPLALAALPRTYDPLHDLIPLCPNCHRAIHSRRPVPYSLEELQVLLRRDE